MGIPVVGALGRGVRRRPATAIAVVAVALRVLALPIVRDRDLASEWAILVPALVESHSYTYYAISETGKPEPAKPRVGQERLPSAYMPPAYAFFLAGLTLVFGEGARGVLWIEIAQAAMAGLTCLALFGIARRLFDRSTAILSGVVFAVYPMLVYSAGQISAVNLYGFLICALILSLLWAAEGDRYWRFVLAGSIGGILVLARADTQLYVPFFALWVALVTGRKRIANAAWFVVACGVVIAPWAARNYREFGELSPLTVSAGLNLWEGQNVNATGTRGNYTDPPVVASPALARAIDSLPPTRDYELRRDEVFEREALGAMRRNPRRVVLLALRKLQFFWGYYWGLKFVYPGASSPLYWMPWFTILPLFGVGLVSSIHQRRRERVLILIVLCLATVVAMGFFVIPRYRMFILPFVIMYACQGALRSWSVLAGSRGSGTLAA